MKIESTAVSNHYWIKQAISRMRSGGDELGAIEASAELDVLAVRLAEWEKEAAILNNGFNAAVARMEKSEARLDEAVLHVPAHAALRIQHLEARLAEAEAQRDLARGSLANAIQACDRYRAAFERAHALWSEDRALIDPDSIGPLTRIAADVAAATDQPTGEWNPADHGTGPLSGDY